MFQIYSSQSIAAFHPGLQWRKQHYPRKLRNKSIDLNAIAEVISSTWVDMPSSMDNRVIAFISRFILNYFRQIYSGSQAPKKRRFNVVKSAHSNPLKKYFFE